MGDKLSINLETYLEILADLSEEHGHAHVKEVAMKMGVKAPSVTSALQSLKRRGLINYQAYSPITLTSKGVRRVAELNSKHSVIKEFLEGTLAMKPYSADKYACKLEHLLDEKVAERIEKMNSFIEENRDVSEMFLKKLADYINK